jgi:hypothetical protein
MTEEPAAERAKEKSNFRGEREIRGHADENAEPYRPRPGFPCGALLFVQAGI